MDVRCVVSARHYYSDSSAQRAPVNQVVNKTLTKSKHCSKECFTCIESNSNSFED